MSAEATRRNRAIDWLRGLVMVLMTVDHAGNVFDAAHLHGDAARGWTPGTPLPPGEFLTRWVTHLCAPTFVLLAGAALAFSDRKRAAGQTRFLVTRGLFIAALDPLWMSLGFASWRVIIFQVLFAIGGSLVAMAFLRRLPSLPLVAIATSIQVGGELARSVHVPSSLGWAWDALLVGGRHGRVALAYPILPWLSIMIFGYVLGRWLLVPSSRARQVGVLAAAGVALLFGFGVLRGIDGYGNWGLHRDSNDLLQWLHVSKYPPSLTFSLLELGLALLLFAGLHALDDPRKPRRALAPLALLGGTAFFYYLLHVHGMALLQAWLHVDVTTHGLAKTWGFAAVTVGVLLGPCALYRRYKAAHPNGWTRYV